MVPNGAAYNAQIAKQKKNEIVARQSTVGFPVVLPAGLPVHHYLTCAQQLASLLFLYVFWWS